MNISGFECEYEKVDNGHFRLVCGTLTLGKCGSFERGLSWYHLGSTFDTPEARRSMKEVKEPLSVAKKMLEQEASNVLNSVKATMK